MLLLKDLMERQNMSGKDLAAAVGLSPAAISNIKNGDRYPSYDVLIKIAKALDVDVRELFPSTKGNNSEALYVKRNGEFIPVGSLKLERNE